MLTGYLGGESSGEGVVSVSRSLLGVVVRAVGVGVAFEAAAAAEAEDLYEMGVREELAVTVLLDDVDTDADIDAVRGRSGSRKMGFAGSGASESDESESRKS